MSGQAGIERARYHRTERCGFLSSVQGSCGLLSKCATCFDSFWSWKQTRGLPLCLWRGQSSRLRVWKWKPKRECFSQRVFPVRPPGHCSNCQKVEHLIHISPPTLFLCLSVCPSFLTLFVSRHGRSHLSDRVLKDSRLCTAGCGICGGEWWWIKSQSLKERAFKE